MKMVHLRKRIKIYMNFYEKISLLLAFLVGAVIFFWSNLPGMAGSGSSLLAILYHFGIFALFSSFIFLSFFKKITGEKFFIYLFFVVLYAALDEVHQFYIPNRACAYRDFFIDLAGIFAGFLFVFVSSKLLNFLRKH